MTSQDKRLTDMWMGGFVLMILHNYTTVKKQVDISETVRAT